jgi:hypothetical protein
VQQPTAIPSLVLLAGAVGFSWSLFFPAVATEPVRQVGHSRGTAPRLRRTSAGRLVGVGLPPLLRGRLPASPWPGGGPP